MVDTVLSRDKNWSRWKVENCPPFQRAAVSPEEFIAAKTGAQAVGTNKRLRAAPMGSLALNFLSDEQRERGLERLKEEER